MTDHLQSKPQLKELVHYSDKIVTCWKQLALQLSLSPEVVDRIDVNHSDVNDKCYHMFSSWLKRTCDPCWCQVASAFKMVKLNEAAGEIKKKFEITHKSSTKRTDGFIVNPSGAISEFVSVVSRIEEILTKSNEVENLKAVKSICGYLPISNHSNKPMFTGEQLKEIDGCENIQKIFRQLQFYLRWDDHLILAAILNRLDSEECEELLGKFQSKIDCQMKLEQIFEERKKQKQEVPKGFVKMVAIANKKYSRITKEEYDQLKCFIAEHCGVESYVLSPFLSMSPSSLLLEWLVPSTAFTHMVETAAKNKQIFIKGSFVFLQIATTVILDCSQNDSKVHFALQGQLVIENTLSKQVNKMVGSLSPKDRETTLSTLREIFNNIIQYPNDDKYRQIRLANKKFCSKVWQYPAGEELMKMSRWVVEGDHVRLRDDSCVQIMLQLLNSLQHGKHVSTSGSSGMLIPHHVFQFLIESLLNGHIFLVQMLLQHISISCSGKVFSESGSSANLLVTATIGQQLDIIKLLLHDYSMDPYSLDIDDERPYIFTLFSFAPQSFIIDILKCCGVKPNFKSNGITLLHIAILTNCFHVVQYLLEECSGMNLNVADDDDLLTPLHLAYLYGHKQIARYLIRHGADINAVDRHGHTPYECSDGNLEFVSYSQHVQNKRRIHHTPFSIEHRYYMKLINDGISNIKAVSLTMEKFPSLKEDDPTQPHHDVDQASGIKEFTQCVTKGLIDDKPWRRPLSQEQRRIRI